MRNQCLRLLLLHCRTTSQPSISQVHHPRPFTPSHLHSRASHVTPKPSVLCRYFSSSPELTAEPPKQPSDEAILLTGIFSKPGRSHDEIKLDLDLNSVLISHDLILGFLKNPDIDPDVARRVFDWVLESQGEKLSSKSYNWMLGILGRNGFVKETWDMIGVMKKKGYGVAKGAFVKISEKFQEAGLVADVEKLKELYASGSASCKSDGVGKENVEMICSRVINIIRSDVWGDDVEKQLQELNLKGSNDLVTTVLENLETEPNKALIFFRWVQESGIFKHNERSSNAMAIILSKEDHSQKFWKFVNEMRGEGHEMERESYILILDRFVKRKMIKDAVDLYEFAMIGGSNKPSANDCAFLLKKIVVSKELDTDLFLKVVGVFKANGNVLTDANFDSVIKSLTSVGRLSECNRLLVAMEESGYVPSSSSRSKIALKLSSCGKTGEATKFVTDYKSWESLIKGCCLARDLKEASNSFREMVEKEGTACAGPALDVLIDTYCRKNRPMEAYRFVLEMVNDKGVIPWNSTFKALTNKLLAKKQFEEALNVMSVMKNQRYPPDLESFVGYLSKKGSAEEAVEFAQAMTLKRFPATSVFIRLIEGYLKSGRKSEAQDFLSKCPGFIRNHADVLDLFCSEKSDGTGNQAVAAV